MADVIATLTRNAVLQAKKVAKSSPAIRRALYQVVNWREFTNLFEHEKMISDAVRVDAYKAAIARHVRPEDMVVDLGTGTGILAIFAAHAGARRIVAIDHSPFIEVARRLAAANGASHIEFFNTNSRNVELAEPVDLILHEQMGCSLFDERMVDNLLDLKRRVLRPGGRILPGRFELFLEPFMLEPAQRITHLHRNMLHGIDFSCLAEDPDVARYRLRDYDWSYIGQGAGTFLCEPIPALAFDLNTMSAPGELPTILEGERQITRDGTLDGLSLHFKAIFDDEIAIDTSPAKTPTHWGNPFFRLPPLKLRAGDRIRYRYELVDVADHLTWSLSVEPKT